MRSSGYRWLAAAALLIGVVARQGEAQSAAQSEAEAVARESFAAVERKDFATVVRLAHRDAIAGMRDAVLQEIRSWDQRASYRPPRDTITPSAVQEWQQKQYEEHARMMRSPVEKLGVKSVEEAEALPAEEFARRWLEANDPRVDMMHQMRTARPDMPASLLQQAIPEARRTVLGSVLEDDSTAHVVYRSATGMIESARMQTAALRRTANGWRFVNVGEDLSGWFGYAFSVHFEQEQQQRQVEDVTRQIAEWPASDGLPAGRAFLSGFHDAAAKPKTMVIEVARQQVTIPVGAFDKLFELMIAASYIFEQQEEPRK